MGRLTPLGITVLGNLAIDRVNGHGPTPGGCPAFVGPALATVPGGGRVVTRVAEADAALVVELLDSYPVPVTVLPATATDRFRIQDGGGEHAAERRISVEVVGDPWAVADVDVAAITTEWVHLAPLVRDQFPAATLRHLVDAGHRISLDGQGLVRPAVVGGVLPDDRFDPGLLDLLAVLKMAESEAAAAGGLDRPEEVLEARGAAEVVVTRGIGGCSVRRRGVTLRLPAARPVVGVPATGAGDVFSVTYAAGRAAGIEPRPAAVLAASRVADLLERRQAATGSGTAHGG